jgi:hypothetical protein
LSAISLSLLLLDGTHAASFHRRYCSSLTCSIQSTTLPSSRSWMAIWVIAVVAVAPCQCFSSGENQTTSPGRTTSTGPPSRWTQPQPGRDDQGLTERMRVPCRARAPGIFYVCRRCLYLAMPPLCSFISGANECSGKASMISMPSSQLQGSAASQGRQRSSAFRTPCSLNDAAVGLIFRSGALHDARQSLSKPIKSPSNICT